MLVRHTVITSTLVIPNMAGSNTLWEPLVDRTRTVFLVAGVWLLGYAVSKVIYTFTDVTPVGAFDVAFGGAGVLVAIAGLLGLYPRLKADAPRTSLAGVVVTAIAAAGTLTLLGWLAGETLLNEGYPAIPEEAPVWAALALFVVFITLGLGFLLFGAASLRTDVLPGTVGRLLLVPGLAWLGLTVSNLVLPPGQYLGVAAYVPISLALLAIGYRFPAGASRTDRAEATADSAA